MSFDDLLARNRAFVAGRPARPLPPIESFRTAVIACYDPRLDPLILPSMGLSPGEAFVFRSAGAQLRRDGAALRSLAVAIFSWGVREIVVMGHTSCKMAQFSSSSFIDAFRGRGVPRDAFGPDDLRAWAGAIADPKRGVLQTVEVLQATKFLPKDLVISGVVLDDTTGALDPVLRPGETARTGVAPAFAEVAPEPPAGAAASAVPATEPVTANAFDRAGQLLGQGLAATAGWKEDVHRLQTELARTKDPLARLRLVESFAEKTVGDSRELTDLMTALEKDLAEGRLRREMQELVRIALRAAGEK